MSSLRDVFEKAPVSVFEEYVLKALWLLLVGIIGGGSDIDDWKKEVEKKTWLKLN